MSRTHPEPGGSLPAELTSFVGRRGDLREVKRLLADSRLVTLTGVGGTGKTRLAVRVAAGVRRAFPDGVWFVDLTSLRAPQLLVVEVQDPEVLAYLVMVTLGLREQPGAGSPMEQLVRHLRDRQVLLVLDNCEHLLPACALLVNTLLRGCPGVRVLATSREPLLVAGEMLVAVPPLPAPVPGGSVSVAELGRVESVALFVARARAVTPEFALTEANQDAVARLCRRLDGLPLAIELAAAWVRALGPADILGRLTRRFALLARGTRNAPERQQTLRGCVDWSFDLCGKPERLLWARLSVFAGGFELDAVEGVCADERLPAGDLLGLVAALVDKSIVIREDVDRAGPAGVARYRMLETIRDYGQEKLNDLGKREQLRARHRDWYLHLVRRAELDWISAREAAWFTRFGRELPNIRAALEFSLAEPDGGDKALTMAGGLFLYWTARGLHSEGRNWLDQALDRPTGPNMTRVKALYASAVLANSQGDLPAVTGRAQQAHEVAVRLGETRAHAIAAAARAVLAMGRGDLTEVARAWQVALDGLAGEQAGEYVFWRVNVLLGLALTKGLLGDVDGAAACHDEILAICRPAGESYYSAFSLWGLGQMLWKQGDSAGAAVRLRDSLRRVRELNDLVVTSWCLDLLSWIDFDEDRPERAATLLGAVVRLGQIMGAPATVFPELAAAHDDYVRRTRDALGERGYQAAFVRGAELSLDEAVGYALGEIGAAKGGTSREDRQPLQAAPPSSQRTSTPLTRREFEVAGLLAEGLSNKEIAARLVISPRTAESHVENILTKLGFTSRAQVAAWMAELRSGDEPEPD